MFRHYAEYMILAIFFVSMTTIFLVISFVIFSSGHTTTKVASVAMPMIWLLAAISERIPYPAESEGANLFTAILCIYFVALWEIGVASLWEWEMTSGYS